MKYAIMFPGQGSQRLGMLGDLSDKFPLIKATFTEASDLLGYDLWHLVQAGQADDLNQSSITQPAILAASYALWRCWQSINPPQPVVMMGHSLGEYSALVCSGALSFASAVKLVQLRGKLMQQASDQQDGMMAVVLGLGDDQVGLLCQEASQGRVLDIANYNAPGQVVVSGERPAVERLVNLARSAGAKRVLPLAVSVAAHSNIMAAIQEDFGAALDKVNWLMPSCHLIQNTLLAFPSDINQMKKALLEQLTSSVPWVAMVRMVLDFGVAFMAECGPQRILCNLNKRIAPESNNYPMDSNSNLLNISSVLDIKSNNLI